MKETVKLKLLKNQTRKKLDRCITRDYLRHIASVLNDTAGITTNTTKLNTIEECEEYIINLVEKLSNCKTDTNELNDLKASYEKLQKGNIKVYEENAHLTAKCSDLVDEIEKLEEDNEELEIINQNLAVEKIKLEDIIKNQKNALTDICIENSKIRAEKEKYKNALSERMQQGMKIDKWVSIIKIVLMFWVFMFFGVNTFEKIFSWFM